jgi:hypothetical protein
MSISRTCRSCGSPLPEHLTDGTCPSCGSAQAGNETPKASGTPADRDGEFVVDLPGDRTGTHRPEAEVASTVVAEPAKRTARKVALQLAGYREIAWLNGGGMGDVYRGIQSGTERRVAIKVMRPSANNYSQNRERFENEIRALGRVDHPGVVRVFECGECDYGPYFSMEFVDGETLAKRVKREGMLDPHEAVRVVRLAAEAVHSAHQVNVLHRDIKPSNVMIAPDGTVKVTDFGLAKHTADSETNELTQTGVVIGTPSYIPPEQAEGHSDRIAAASDVYGLGATLYHLLTGSPPHTSNSPTRNIRRARLNEVVPPTVRRPDLCPVLGAIVERSLSYDPKDRFATAEAFARELSRWSAGEPTETLPPNRIQRFGRWIHRNRTAVSLVGLLLVVAAAAAIVARVRDEKGRIERALARGESITLVAETGEPKWHAWVGVPSQLRASLLADGTYGFTANPAAGLVLVDDPQVTDYVFRAEIQHQGGLHSVPGGLTRNDAGKVGLFFGSQKLTAPDAVAHLFFSVDFNDLPWRTAQKPDADDYGHLVGFHMNCFPELPNLYMTNREIGNSGIHRFPYISNQPPGEWRTIEIEIRPSGCAIRWKKLSDGSIIHVKRYEAEKLDEYLISRHVMLSSLDPPRVWSPVRPWSPRQPLGVYSYNSTVAVRNAAIEPLPPSP